MEERHENISALNRRLIEAVCRYLNIGTVIKNSWEYDLVDGKTERLVALCEQANGTEYISGPAARDYIDKDVFDSKGIALSWFDYAGYPPYPQLWGEFVHGVTILDLLFNCGAESSSYMRYVKK